MNAPVDPLYLRRGDETEAARRLRQRLEKASHRCLLRAEHTRSPDAEMHMSHAARLASVWAYASATEAQLDEVIREITYLHLAANAAERRGACDAE